MLDIKTLMLLYLLVTAVSAGAMAIIWSQNRGRFAGISLWLSDMVLQTVGLVLIILRGTLPDLISMTLANTLVVAAAIIILVGLQRFTAIKVLQFQNYVLLAVFIGISAYYSHFQPDLTARNIALSAALMIITFQCAWLLLIKADPGIRPITRLTGIVFAGYSAFSFVRIVLHIVFPEQSNDLFKSSAVDSLAITGYIVLNICLTLSLVLMVNQRLLAEVKAQEEKFTTAFHSSPYAITLTRPADGKIFEVNDGFVSMSGYQYPEVIGKTTLDLNLWASDEDRLAVVNELTNGREVHGKEYQFRRKTGDLLTGLFSASLVKINGETSILSSIGDISGRKQMEQQLLAMATHDSLTGLPNRILLYDRSEVALANARRNNKKVVVMSLDLDFFKNVNDMLGHDTGDKLLMAAAGRLTGALRKSDTVARMGGDEFVLLLWEVENKEDAVNVAEKILKNFRKPFVIDGQTLTVTVSIGIAIYPDNGDTIEDLLKSSDKSLYSAKHNGRDRYAI
jgi:diguanylate cyclase (GGDEF)-like protein/PAS domain S-box-containing protein